MCVIVNTHLLTPTFLLIYIFYLKFKVNIFLESFDHVAIIDTSHSQRLSGKNL